MGKDDREQGRQAHDDLEILQNKVKEQGFALCKWGRMLNALIVVLEQKRITDKDEIMMKVYERWRDSGALERH